MAGASGEGTMTTNCPPSVAPPGCCQPPMSQEVWGERTRRYRAAYRQALESRPTACRNCGADELVETFDPSHHTFACEACGDVGEYLP